MTEETALATMPDPTTHNVLVPQKGVLGRISKFHTVTYNIITIDVPVETYGVQGGGVALHKSALNKIATAAGIRIVKSAPIGEITPDHIIWQVEVEMPLGGDKAVRGIGTKEWQKGVGKDGNDQEHRIGKTETKALLRAVRQVLGIKTKYDKAELAKPIAVPHILYDPDMDDEGVRMAVAGQRSLASATLYGPEEDNTDDFGPEAAAAAGCDAVTGEIIEEADYEVVEDEPMPAPVAEEAMPGPVEEDTLEEQRHLQNRALMSPSSPFNGRTFASIFEDPKGGLRWFEAVVLWAQDKPNLPDDQKKQVDAIKRFIELVKRSGGQLV